MKRFFCVVVVVVVFTTVNVWADGRFDIWRDREGKKGVVELVFGQPSYETEEGKRCVASLTPVPAVECEATGFGTFEFANENSKGQPIRCRFNPSKSAIVFVDGTGEPLYIKGCRDGNFCNRIRVIRKKVTKVSEVEKVPCPPPRVVCEERIPEPEARVCLDIPEVRPYLPEIDTIPIFFRERHCQPSVREGCVSPVRERYSSSVRCRSIAQPNRGNVSGRLPQFSSRNLNCVRGVPSSHSGGRISHR